MTRTHYENLSFPDLFLQDIYYYFTQRNMRRKKKTKPKILKSKSQTTLDIVLSEDQNKQRMGEVIKCAFVLHFK